MRPDETSAVHVSRNNTMIVCTSNRADGYMLDLVKMWRRASVATRRTCDRQIKISVQLESLILAQSERWRQA